MAKGKEFPLFVIMKAVDKATAPLRALGHTAANVAKPFQKLREMHNKAILAAEANALGKIGTAAFKAGKSIKGCFNNLMLLGKVGLATAGYAFLKLGSLFTFTKLVANYGNNVLQTSQKIGMSVKSWQELRHAGEELGVEQDRLSVGLIQLNKNMVLAATGNKNMKTWFARAGVAVTDASGKIRNVEDVFSDLAGVMNRYRDGAKKTAVATALMGESGANLIPVMNSGKKGLTALREEARALGIVFDKETAESSKSFIKNINRLMKSIKGILFYVGSLLIPVFDDLVRASLKWVQVNREIIKSELKDWIDNLRVVLPKLKDDLLSFINIIKKIVIGISKTIKALGGLEGILKALTVVVGVMFVGSVASAIKAIIALGVVLVTNPIGAAIVGIVAAVSAVVYAFKNWDKIKKYIQPLLDLISIVSPFGAIINAVFSIIKSLDKLKEWWQSFDAFMQSLFAGQFAEIERFLKKVQSMLAKLKEWFGGIKTLIPDFLLPGSNVTINPPSGQGKEARVLPAAGVIQQNQTVTQKSAAEVKVEFANAPKGTTVKTQKNNGVDMDLNMGYAMATH